MTGEELSHGNCTVCCSTVEPLYSGHPWDRKVSLIERCPHFRGQNVHNPCCDSTSCPDKRGALISGPYRGIPLSVRTWALYMC